MNIPKYIDIVEVGPRDGFQNVKRFIQTEDKIEIIKGLVDAGVRKMEVTSFVHPKWVPQLADASKVIEAVRQYAEGENFELIALVPNQYGALKAKENMVDTITYVISVSERHNKENVNRTIEQSFRELEEIIIGMEEIKVRLALATTFGCPFGDEIPIERTIQMAKRGVELGCNKVILADTIGFGNPLQVKRIINQVKEHVPVEYLGAHFHNTKGMGLANSLVAIDEGITYLESAAGGLGGCPFAPGAAGNIATEDIVNMLHQMGIATSIDLDSLLKTVDLIKNKVDEPVNSYMGNYNSCKK